MTILSFHVLSPDHVIATADSEIYDGGEPSGEFCKVAVNPLGTFVGMGCGSLGFVRDAGEVVRRVVTFDQAEQQLPAALRSARADALAGPAARPSAIWARYCVIGHSQKWGRIVGYVFHPETLYMPTLTRAWCAPAIEGGPDIVVDEQSALVAAQQQLHTLRETVPAATGGRLIIITIHGTLLTTSVAFDLATGKRPTQRTPTQDTPAPPAAIAVEARRSDSPAPAAPADRDPRARSRSAIPTPAPLAPARIVGVGGSIAPRWRRPCGGIRFGPPPHSYAEAPAPPDTATRAARECL